MLQETMHVDVTPTSLIIIVADDPVTSMTSQNVSNANKPHDIKIDSKRIQKKLFLAFKWEFPTLVMFVKELPLSSCVLDVPFY
jgi:hypothetical protein